MEINDLVVHVGINHDDHIIFNNFNINFNMRNNTTLSYFLNFINQGF